MREVSSRLVILFFCLTLCGALQCNAPTEEVVEKEPLGRPSWLADPTITGGSNQEPLIFKIRRGNRLTTRTEQDYLDTHKEKFVLELKDFGANFFMTHLFKAFGVEAEADEIARAKEFAVLLHKHGFRVGTYVGSTIAYETFLAERPEAIEWLVDDFLAKPVIYGGTQYFRRRPYFAHPGYKQYIQDILRTGIEEIRTDLIHFDNPANQAVPEVFFHPLAIEEFREFLRKKYTPEELTRRIGFSNTDYLVPPRYVRPDQLQAFDDPVAQEWIDFRCQKLADHYREMARFIRRLDSEVAVEINPHGITGVNRAWESSVDFARLLPYVDFFWCEDGNPAGISSEGILVSNIRSYKLARAFDNNVFNGIGNSEVMIAENLAFNPHSLTRPAYSLKAYVDFYLEHYDRIYRETETVATVALLRNFPSMAYNNYSTHQSTILFEQSLIQAHIPFDLVYGPHLKDLSKYDVLILANQECLSQQELELITGWVRNGGGLVATEDSSLLTEWRRRRPTLGLGAILGVDQPREAGPVVTSAAGDGRTVYLPSIEPSVPRPPTEPMTNEFWGLPVNHKALVEAVLWANDGRMPVQVEAPSTTVIEATSQVNSPVMTVHFINYDKKVAAKDIILRVTLESGQGVESAEWLSPDLEKPTQLNWESHDGQAVIAIPDLRLYGVAAIRLEESNGS